MDDDALREEATRFRQDVISIHEEVGKVIAGQKRVIECTVTALVAGGNVLLEGVPGLGKTELVKTLSKVLDLDFKRIQFTPDLMPADIIGTKVMTSDAAGRYQFEFRRGPIFTQLLLADEINRATPKTQSALLETMQECSVTADGTTHHLKAPFFVLATQNPLEQEGTYPLPEAQLDRFMFKTTVPFLSLEELNEVLHRTIVRSNIDVAKILDGERILTLREALDRVVIAPPMLDYASRLVLSTHPKTEHANEQVKTFVRWGASPRAGQALLRAARVRALTDGRVHVAFEDVRHFAVEVLGHRVLLNYDGLAEGLDIAELVTDAVSHTPETTAS
jgi:MoxR-like ATPase